MRPPTCGPRPSVSRSRPLMKSGCSGPAPRSRSPKARPESWPRAGPTPSAGTSRRRTATARPSPPRASTVPATSCGAVGMPDPRRGDRGCASVVPRDPRHPPALADICAYLEAEGLAKYKWPERLELIDALPRTQVGKVSKVTLRADIGAKLEHETTPRKPAVTA